MVVYDTIGARYASTRRPEHHWTDLEAGIGELRRIARRRIVVLTWDQQVCREFWLLREYLPEAAAFDDARAVPIDRLASRRCSAAPASRSYRFRMTAPTVSVSPSGAGPEAYLDPVVRAGMSILAQPGDDVLRPGLRRLAADLDSGRWRRRHRDLLARAEYDGGYRLLIAEP